MSYAVNDEILCNVEVCPNGTKRILIREPDPLSGIEMMTFTVVAVDEPMGTYKVVIPEDVSGWIISRFHIKFQHVDEKFLGKKFYDITESLILDKVKKRS